MAVDYLSRCAPLKPDVADDARTLQLALREVAGVVLTEAQAVSVARALARR